MPSNNLKHDSFSQSALIALMNALLLSFPSISISTLFRRVFVQLSLYYDLLQGCVDESDHVTTEVQFAYR